LEATEILKQKVEAVLLHKADIAFLLHKNNSWILILLHQNVSEACFRKTFASCF